MYVDGTDKNSVTTHKLLFLGKSKTIKLPHSYFLKILMLSFCKFHSFCFIFRLFQLKLVRFVYNFLKKNGG